MFLETKSNSIINTQIQDDFSKHEFITFMLRKRIKGEGCYCIRTSSSPNKIRCSFVNASQMRQIFNFLELFNERRKSWFIFWCKNAWWRILRIIKTYKSLLKTSNGNFRHKSKISQQRIKGIYKHKLWIHNI